MLPSVVDNMKNYGCNCGKNPGKDSNHYIEEISSMTLRQEAPLKDKFSMYASK